jgi:thiosulfate/3-mercaptopyruvate sulfurtransferase
LNFIIGLNSIPSFDRPYKYVPVRHVPIDQDSFAYYGDELLPNYDSLPTWAYATPHNIQRETPQAETCNACHGNPDLFLTIDKVAEDEQMANQFVIVRSIPELISDSTSALDLTNTIGITNSGVITDTQGITNTEQSP